MASETEGMVGYLEIPTGEKVYEKWTFTAVSPEKLPIGRIAIITDWAWGDVNRDGRMDIVIPHGWWKARRGKARHAEPGSFHPHFLTPDGKEAISPPPTSMSTTST